MVKIGNGLSVTSDGILTADVINNLTSTSTTNAVSAYQAKLLNDKFNNYQIRYKYTADLSSLDVNKYYPVMGYGMPLDGMHRFKLCVALNSGTKPSWSTHDQGFSCCCDVLNEGGGWGTTDVKGIVLENSFKFTNSNPVCYQQLTSSSRPVFWCRGGGKYFIWTDYQETWTVYTSSVTFNEQTVEPRTTLPEINFALSTIRANISGNTGYFATELYVLKASGEADLGVGTNSSNKMYLYSNSNGTRGIYDSKFGGIITASSDSDTGKVFNGIANRAYYDDAGNRIRPEVAYANSSGTSGTVTLSVDSTNYKHIRINYKNGDTQWGSTTQAANTSVSGDTVYGTIVRKNTSDTNIMLNSALFAVSGKTITISRNSQANVNFGSKLNESDTNKLYITRVELWN